MVGFQRLGLNAQAQVVGQRFALAHGKHARFGQRVVLYDGNVTSGKDQRVGDALQAVVDDYKTMGIECQPGTLQPRRATGLRDPHDLVSLDHLAVSANQSAGQNLCNCAAQVQHDAALSQHPHEALAHPRVVGGQKGGF